MGRFFIADQFAGAGQSRHLVTEIHCVAVGHCGVVIAVQNQRRYKITGHLVIGRQRFGVAWKPDRGVLQFDTPMGRLRPGVASPEGVQADDVAFFVERNPGWQRGDELCCLGRVDGALIVGFAAKQLRRGLRRG